MKEIIEHFKSLNVSKQEILEWSTIGGEKAPQTILKLKQNLPTKEEHSKWCLEPKTFTGLQRIKLPLLCGWTVEEVIQAMTPYTKSLTSKFRTERHGQEDCNQDGAIGIIHALKTDAGISPFPTHAYTRIKTAIRRSSATSGVVSKPERMPSKTEARSTITEWFLRKDLISKDDLKEYQIQKIGMKNVTERHVPESLQLNQMPINEQLELFDYIETKFRCNQLDIDSLKIKTVGDLVQYIASPPDFNGMLASLSSSSDDEDKKLIDSIVSNQETPDKLAHKNMIFHILQCISENFTPSQKVVYEHSYGINGKAVLDNHEIADRFSELSIGSKNVSRQRINQYQKAIIKKLRKILLQIFRSDIEDKYFEDHGEKVAIENIPEEVKLNIMSHVLS